MQENTDQNNSEYGHFLHSAFDKASLKLAIFFFLITCFLVLIDCHFQQIIGVRLGSEPAAFLANLFFITIGIYGRQDLVYSSQSWISREEWSDESLLR